jgi:hypothetical protein
MPSTTASTLLQLSSMPVALFHHLGSNNIARCLLGGLGLLLSNCSKSLPLDQYNAYLADPAHGLTHTVEVNGATVTCTYRPTDLLVQQDITNVPAATPATRDSIARAYVGKTYCALTLSHTGQELESQFVNDPTTYQQVLTYLNTGLAADAFLVTTPHDSVAAAASMYVRQYGTTGHSTVLLVFDTHQFTPQHGFHLTLRGQYLGLGTLHFPFAAADLAALPPLQSN